MSSADGPRDDAFPVTGAARRDPDAPALVATGAGSARHQVVSWGELAGRIRAVAAGALSLGLRPGDRVALRHPAVAGHPPLLLGLLRAGIVAVPLSTRLPPAAVPPLLAAVGCAALVARGDDAAAAGSGVRRVSPEDLLEAGGPGASRALPPFDPSADATIVFTSGSSGRPKAALHTWAAHAASAAGANANLPFGPGDRWLLSLPLWHVGGLGVLFRAVLGGGAVALPPPGAALAAAITQLRATHLSVVATQLARLLRDPAGDAALAGVRAVLLGGGPAPEPLVREAVRRGVPLLTSYGSTELASTVTATRPGDPPELLLTAGRALPGREVRTSPHGEILARGATLMRGYVSAGGLDPARDAAGWFATGDLGRIGPDGCLRVTGRRDAMFVSGGENIHPEEIEAELQRHPGVEEAVVVPVPDAEFGERPAAFVRAAGAPPAAAELDAFLRRTLPGFKVPVRYLPWPPRAGGIKPPRAELRRLARGDGGEEPP